MKQATDGRMRFLVLDSFRGLCAIFVVMYHISIANSIAAHDFFRSSYLFVEFFFILSGFVLAHSYAYKDGLTFKTFIFPRAFRIFPLHLFVLTMMIGIEFCKLYAQKEGFHFQAAAFTGDNSLSEVIPNALLIHAWTYLTSASSFNGPSWSISIEFYLYVILFITLVLNRKARNIIWFVLSGSAFAFIFFRYAGIPETVLRGLSCFFAGVIVYTIYRKLNLSEKVKSRQSLFSIIEIALIISAFILISIEIQNKSILSSLLFSLMIMVFSFEAGIVSKMLKNQVFVLIGKLSFSIYLTHTAILLVLTSTLLIVEKKFKYNFTIIIDKVRYIDIGNSLYNNCAILSLLTSIILFSYITYRIVELPCQEFGRRISSK